jgi:hypothetical protein
MFFAAEIGLAHAAVGVDLGDRAFGDLDAEVEHHHALAQPAHELHVVLDDDEGHAARRDRIERPVQRLGLRRVEPGGRLVEQQHARRRKQGAHQFDALLDPVGQRAAGSLA